MAERAATKSQRASAKAYHHGDLRAALLKAAEAELAARGIEGFSLRGCAKRAGVSHAAPAHHFGDADGLLTALAAEGFRRFTAAMRARQAEGGRRPLDAAGIGYLDFALANPALFRLMFTSDRPRKGDAECLKAAGEAFGVLVTSTAEARGGDPWGDAQGPADIAAGWALAHGLADLLLSGRLDFLEASLARDRDGVLAGIFGRLRLQAPA